MVLALLGADVIKVEPPTGDPLRPTYGPFAASNRGKRSVCIDLKSTSGRAALDGLLARSDVLVHNFRRPVVERLRLTQEHLAEVNPSLIIASLSGFGVDGPRADEPAFDQVLQALCGHMAREADADGNPLPSRLSPGDVATGLLAAFGVVSALFARESTGCGHEVRCNLLDTNLFLLSDEIEGWRPRGPSGKLLQAADGVVVFHEQVDATPPGQQTTLPFGVGTDREADDVIARSSVGELLDRAASAGYVATAGPSEDQWRARGTSLEVEEICMATDTADTYQSSFVRLGLDFDPCCDLGEGVGVPAMGQHTADVLHEAGFSEGELNVLFGDGVIC